MYRAFKMPLVQFPNPPDLTIFEKQVGCMSELLRFSSNEGRIDGTKLRELMFPQNKDTHVFLSHSHRDIETAIQLSNWLYDELGITTFIDSAVWLYADDLLREIDNQYCYRAASKTYSYEKRNGTTSHVHMMLASALSLMLDSCECAIFLHTPNSVSRTEAVEHTGSPWIMYETNLMGIIRPKPPVRQIQFSTGPLEESQKIATASLQINYTLDLSALPNLGARELNEWRTKCGNRRGVKALDLLYELHRPNM